MVQSKKNTDLNEVEVEAYFSVYTFSILRLEYFEKF